MQLSENNILNNILASFHIGRNANRRQWYTVLIEVYEIEFQPKGEKYFWELVSKIVIDNYNLRFLDYALYALQFNEVCSMPKWNCSANAVGMTMFIFWCVIFRKANKPIVQNWGFCDLKIISPSVIYFHSWIFAYMRGMWCTWRTLYDFLVKTVIHWCY